MSKNSFFSTVGQLPFCDFCKQEGRHELAWYDFKTKIPPDFSWFNGCAAHYMEHRLAETLGEGRGQVLCIPRPGSMVGGRIQLMPASGRAVYKPAYLFCVDEDNHGWKGLPLTDRGEPTSGTIFPYQKGLWRDARHK
jgi:hypothetical protein